MQKTLIPKETTNLKDLGNVVPEGYKYYKKIVTPGLLLNVPGACLKWYNLYPAEIEITEQQVLEARAFIKAESIAGRLKLQGELGFVILHRAGDYLLLMVTTWRDTNEMWESVYFKMAADKQGYAARKFENGHKGTYCVWELGPVWHERNAWVNFIESRRDEGAKRNYLSDVFKGEV